MKIKIVKWTPREIKYLLKQNLIHMYIKPTKVVHDSGFGCFEVGYCKLGKEARVSEKMVLSKCSDHIWFRNCFDSSPQISWRKPIGEFDFNMDLTLDGYIRIFEHNNGKNNVLQWENDDWLPSTAEIERK